ncbi:OmpA family protein [Cronobacter sakazakii]|uniref:OmpA family protein n=1 Tax=Cronobacter sakazakii TaxID=28141 RepID=UPI002DB6B3E9|nr:OmpA family protein [Cronobacter sakazakii]MEB8628469.1 OmpA family protein [Cronobacter sakazakii]
MSALHRRSARRLTGTAALLAFIATQLMPGPAGLNNACAIVALLAGLCFIGEQLLPARQRTLKAAEPANHQQVILIVGPFAARWFNRTGYASDLRTEQDTLWLLAATAEVLQTRVEKVRLKHPQAQIRLWLPLLPDGYDDVATLAAQLEEWQRSVAALGLAHPLPCCVAIYARLSNTDSVYWTGLHCLSPWTETPTTTPFETLAQAFDAMGTSNNIETRQRSLMGKPLLNWLQTTPLREALMPLTTHPTLCLSGIVVADDGQGFTRHGAWARFLENQYGVLPPLSSALLLPPLPPALKAVSLSHDTVKNQRTAGTLLSVTAVFILLTVSLLTAFQGAREQIQLTTSLIAHTEALEPWRIRARRAALAALEAQQQRLLACAETPRLIDWGLSPCLRLQEEAHDVIGRYRNLPYFSSQAPVSLFSSGSARLRPHGPAALQPLFTLVNQHPENRFLIIGHSDNTGSPEVNQQLSVSRAIAVREWLVKTTKRPAIQFDIYGLGASEPVAGNDNETGRELNRRVEAIALPADSMEIRKFKNE